MFLVGGEQVAGGYLSARRLKNALSSGRIGERLAARCPCDGADSNSDLVGQLACAIPFKGQIGFQSHA